MVKYLAFDLETTGREPLQDRITEFCFIELDEDLRELGRWTRLVDPGRPIPQLIQQITGITDDMVRGQPPFARHAARIQQLVQDATLIAHNVEFDMRFLHAALDAAGQPGLSPDHPCIDTLQIERHFVNNRLGSVFQRYTGRTMDGAHRSQADTEATVEVLRRQRQVHAAALPATLEGLLAPKLEAHFDGPEGVRRWLDHGHCFYSDPGGTVRFGFGPHRGEPALQHEYFLLWMRGKDRFGKDTKAAIELILKARPTLPTPGTPA